MGARDAPHRHRPHLATRLILHDEVDAGAAIAADALGVPRVEVVVLGAGGTTERDRWAAGVARTARELGRPGPPAPPVLTVEPAPPGSRNPADPLPGPVLRTRPAALEQAPGGAGPPGAVLDWLDRVPDRPVVWFTLGTVFHQESGDLFDRVTGGLSRLDASVVVTVGPGIDPAELGPRPARVRVERHVPQQVLLPRCHLLVCHGGSGSVLGALALGVPMLLLPLGADQPATTDRCLALGVATPCGPPARRWPRRPGTCWRTAGIAPPPPPGGRPAPRCRRRPALWTGSGRHSGRRTVTHPALDVCTSFAHVHDD